MPLIRRPPPARTVCPYRLYPTKHQPVLPATAGMTEELRKQNTAHCSHFVLFRDSLTGHRYSGSTGLNARDTVAREPVRCVWRTESQTKKENVEGKRIHCLRRAPLAAHSLRVHGVVLQVWQLGGRDVAMRRARAPPFGCMGLNCGFGIPGSRIVRGGMDVSAARALGHTLCTGCGG